MNRPIAALLAAVLAMTLIAGPATLSLAEDKGKEPAPAPGPKRIVFSGKVYCSLVRPVALPFHGVINELGVRAGQKVARGEVLASYQLSPDSILLLAKRLNPFEADRLVAKLAEIQQLVDEAKLKVEQAQGLAGQDLAPPEVLARARRVLSLAGQQRGALAAQVAKARKLAARDRQVVFRLLGQRQASEDLPQDGALVSPIDGHVIWIDPNLRPGAEMKPTNPAMVVGVMQPMLVRSQVHEIEALKLSLGDKAEVTVESIPGKVFPAKVSRISWSPITLDPLKPSYYEVELSLQNPGLDLKMGLKAQVTVLVPR